MDPGKLRNELTIEEWGHTTEEDGTWTETWCDRGTVWGSITPLMGRELYAAQQVTPTTTHKVWMRYWPGLTAEHRLRFGTRIFQLEAPPVNPEERNEYWHCLCREEPNA